MKFISPKTTERPTDSRNSTIAYCSPLRSWMASVAGSESMSGTGRGYGTAGLWPACRLEAGATLTAIVLELATVRRVLDVLDAVEDVEIDLVPHLFRFVDVD